MNKLVVLGLAVSALVACGGGSEESAQTAPGTGGPNRAPTISGSPPTQVAAGSPYSFTPQASDPDGDSVTFSVQNRPSWASFNSTTGRLSGTPSSGDIGTYANVSISVSDGSLGANLSAFTVTVNGTVAGSATVSWSPPTTRSDGTALTNLAGYRIYYGNAPGQYGTTLTLNNAGLSSYVVEGLSPGTYYFAVTAFDATGVESDFSPPASKSIT